MEVAENRQSEEGQRKSQVHAGPQEEGKLSATNVSGANEMRYQLNLEVKLMEVPEPQEIKLPKPGDDPMTGIGIAVGNLMQSPVFSPQAFYGAAGLDFRKSVQLSVPDFMEATKVLRRFHVLLEEIECQHIRTEV